MSSVFFFVTGAQYEGETIHCVYCNQDAPLDRLDEYRRREREHEQDERELVDTDESVLAAYEFGYDGQRGYAYVQEVKLNVGRRRAIKSFA